MSEIKSLICVHHGGKAINLSNFYKAKEGSIYKGIGYIPICKKCLYEKAEQYYKKYKDMKVAIYYLCELIDVAFSSSVFYGAAENEGNDIKKVFQSYMRQYNSIGATNNIQSSFRDGEHLEESARNDTSEDNITDLLENNDIEIDRETKLFWGFGFEPKDYLFLETELEHWKRTHKCDNRAEITLLKEICIKILEIRKKRENGESVSKEQKELQDLMKTASVDPAKANAIDDAMSVDAYGMWIKDIEQFEPAEYFEDKTLFEDFDRIKKYTDKYIFRPLKNLLTGSRDFDIDDAKDVGDV